MQAEGNPLDAIDLAWFWYKKIGLPPPSPSRLLTRAQLPSDTLEFFRKYYGISPSHKISLEFANLDHPGHVSISKSGYTIRLNAKFEGWHDAIAAIMSHEMVHVLMDTVSLHGRNTWEDEIFTDAIAIYLGTFLIAKFSANVDYYADFKMVSRLGYLEEPERKYATARFLYAAQVSAPVTPSGPWRSSDLEGLRPAEALLSNRRNVPAIRNENNCPRCATTLDRKDPEIWCSTCGAQWKKSWMKFALSSS